MKKLLKKEIGITLVALIVTVIILLILAGISIASLTGNGLFEKAKLAKDKQENAQIEEDEKLGDYENKIGEYIDNSRETVTLPKEEYDKLMKKGYTLLWEGIANSANTYYFKEKSYDVDNYDFILIEYYQSNSPGNYSTSSMISQSTIIKGESNDIALWGYSTRYTTLHFINNGFVVDGLCGDSGYYEYITKIWGINL